MNASASRPNEAEALYRDLFEQAPEAIVIHDAKGRIVDANRRAGVLLGCEVAGLLDREVRGLHASDWVLAADQVRGTVLQSARAVRYESRFLKPDGESFPAEVRCSRLESGGRVLIQMLVRDVTDQHELREQLRQAQKMEAVGRLAGGVAHDFNNLLTGILGYSEILLDEGDLDSGSRENVEEIREAGRRAASLTRQLLAFSRRQVLRPTALDLTEVVVELTGMLERLLGEDIELEVSMGREDCRVVADRGQIEQMLVNFAANARDAMPSGGRFRIDVRNVEVDDEEAARFTGFRAGRYVRVELTDTGGGMDAVTASRVFEPFFTTKGHGRGTGLGLSTVYGAVKQSGGWVYVESEPGKGSRFSVFLAPAEPVEQDPAVAAASATAKAGEGSTILVVEDEAGLRRLVRLVLEERGYEVLEAANSEQAKALMRQRGDDVDLVLSDVVIPGVSGPQLVQDLLEERLDLKVVFMTGYSDEAVASRGLHGLELERYDLLQKPFTADTLKLAVHRALS